MFYTGGVAKRRAHGEGSIVQIADGTWRAAVPLPDGRRKWLRGKTRAEVARKAAEVKATRDQGMPVTKGRETLGDYLDRWLEDSVKPSVRLRTYDGYASHVRLYLRPMLGRVRLADVSPDHVQRMMNTLAARGLSPRTILHVHATLRRALGQAERWGLVPRNVSRLVTPPKVERTEIAPLSVDEARSLMAAVEGHRLQALYAVALGIGLRQGEAMGLRWQDVDLNGRLITVHHQLQRRSLPANAISLGPHAGLVPVKTHRSRRGIAVPESVIGQLIRHRARQNRERLLVGAEWPETDLVFTTRKGTPLDGPRLTRQLKVVLAQAGLPPRRWHDLRHSCGSILAAQSVPVSEIQSILGHAQVSTTMVYVHSLSEAQRQAAQKMDDALFGE